MGPDITNNKSGNSPHAYRNLMETTIINILEVVIMIRMTSTFYAIFMKMLTRAFYEAFVAMAEGEGAIATNPK